jgi:CBS domain-containing protein
MSSPVLAVGVDDSVAHAHDLMRSHRVSAVLVLGKDGTAAGVISRRDLLRARLPLRGALPSKAASELMSRPVIAVPLGAPVRDACRLLVERHIHRVFVLEDGRPAGVFSTREAMAAVREARIDRPLGDCVRRDIVSVETTTPVREAIDLLESAGVGGVIVIEGTLPVGLFTEREALEARGHALTTPTEELMTAALLCLPAATPLFRAAGFALATTARRIVVTDHHHAKGVVTGLDFARIIASA